MDRLDSHQACQDLPIAGCPPAAAASCAPGEGELSAPRGAAPCVPEAAALNLPVAAAPCAAPTAAPCPSAAAASDPAAAAAPCVPVLSKNQQKKIAKLQRKHEMYQQRKEEKKQEKARKREEKRSRKQADAPELTEEELAAKRAAQRERSRQRTDHAKAVAHRLQEAETSAPKLVLDLDFWDLMTDGFRRSLVSQVAYSAGCNKKSEKPCSIHLSSFDGEVAQAVMRQFPGHTNWAVKFHSEHWSTALSDHKESLVYLTADAEEEIQALDASCYYIIGGLVDRNQHKRICLNRAEEHGIRTARLPLGNCLQLAGSKVLTVNQVVSILVNFWVTQDWRRACEIAVPGRKRSRDVREADGLPAGDHGMPAGEDVVPM